MATYNTGTTFSATNITAATAFTGTIPAGVAVGDVMIVSVNVFSFSQTTASVSTPTSGGGSWTQIGTLLTGSQGAVTGWASTWYRVATAGDAGSTFSMSWTGSTGAGNQFWWAADLEAYTGFYTASPIGNFNTVVSSGTSVVAPSTTTARASSWAIYTCPTSVSGSGSITAAPTTSRHIINPGAGVDNAISDSAGSVGGAGTAIGGGTFTLSASSSGDGISFTIELCTQAPPGPSTAQTTPPRIPHPLWWQLLEVAQTRADWQAQGVASLATQHWRLMDGASGRPGVGSTGTQPPASATANSGNLVPGLSFYVTQGGTWFEGYWWYVTASGGQSTAAQKFALWSDAPASASGGTVVPGTVVTSGTLSTGWNWIPLATPVQLSLYSVYVAATTANSGPFPETASQYSSGGPYQGGISNGPLACFSDANGTNPPPSGYVGNGCFSTAGSDPSLVMPATDAANAGDLLWLDVQVTNTPPAGYQGSYRLWPNTLDADYATQADAAFNYVIGTEIVLAQACVVNAIWYYIPTGQGSSNNQWATSADIWRVRDGVRVATQPNPVWLKPFTGGVDGSSNSGRWVYTQFPGTVTLPAGDYYFTIYNGNGSPNGWGSKRLGYWQAYQLAPNGTFKNAAPGAAGITNGPLYAPTTPAASTAYEYNGSNPGATPPYSDGVVEPGQSVFAQGPPNQLPYLYVTGLFQNYWIDVEVTPASTFTPDAPDLPQRLPHPMFTRLLEIADFRAAGAPPPPVTSVTAQLATGTGTAVPPVQAVTANAGLATGTGAAQQPTAAVTVPAGLATGTGAAPSPAAAITVLAGLATGTGTALQPVPAVTVNAGLATGAGAALQPTVSTSSTTTANAGLATGTGTALAPVPVIIVSAGLATGTGAALQPSVSTSGNTTANAQLATGAGAAVAPVPVVTATAGLATGTGAALNILRPIPAGLATGTGAAPAPAIAVLAQAAVAQALAAALNGTIPAQHVRATSAATVTDPRDGTATVTATAASVSSVS